MVHVALQTPRTILSLFLFFKWIFFKNREGSNRVVSVRKLGNNNNTNPHNLDSFYTLLIFYFFSIIVVIFNFLPSNG